MKCRFCGKRIKKNSNVCSKCGREVTEGLATDELIDALPELHDEFDNISKIQEKERKKEAKKEKRAKSKTPRIVVAILIILAILAGVAVGTLYFKQKELERKAEEEAKIPTTSAIDSQVEKSFMKGGFTDTLVTDEFSAKELIKEQKEVFSFVDADSEFSLEREIKIGKTTVYRFAQKYNGISVYGGEMVIMADSSGNVIGFNGVYIPTKGLMTDYLVDDGSASAAITEYVNSLEDFAVVSGISITDIEKAICNTDNKTHLAYKANVSGYNDSAEYIAYDVFVDGVSGEGICVSVTSSFENESIVTQDEVEESYIFKLATASDKFNWNDESMGLAREPISIEDVNEGNASPYILGVKKAVDSAYNYFNKSFGWKGLSGDGESFLVYINPGEYVEEDLPTERAMYTNNQLMFFREDLTQGDIDYNTVMHEYAHGVMHNLVGFHGTMGFTQNSAIAEGLADVFAELAEAAKGGIAPDWLHGARNLYAPSEEYYVFIPDEVSINNVDDCYKYSTIVSHTAAEIAQIMPSVAAQNEFWFKAMCLMTSNTDFSELSSILNAVATNMHEEKSIDDTSFDSIISVISALDEGQKEAEIA